MYTAVKLLPFLWISAHTACAFAFPEHHSLAGLSSEEVERVSRTFQKIPAALPVPTPIKDTSSKLVNDAQHPWKPLRPGDIRGPCPGLNTLASHGYVNRSGVTTPAEIIEAVQVAFNFGFDLATFVTFTAFLGDGNLVTNLISIGSKTVRTGPDSPPPASIGGFNTHGIFEGDASTSRGDTFFGDNFSFNETLFRQLETTANQFSNDSNEINFRGTAEVRWNRIQDSIARNPTFDLTFQRWFSSYAESIFPLAYFANGSTSTDPQQEGVEIPLEDMRSFFQHSRFPCGFFRREGPFGLALLVPSVDALRQPHYILPGRNADNKTNNYVTDDGDELGDFCSFYTLQIGKVQKLYPNPKGVLRRNLIQNMKTYYGSFGDPSCPPADGWLYPGNA